MNNQLSYWEIKSWLTGVDFCVIGSGIVGLNCAIELKTKYPKSKVLVLERGYLPQGASTKNAGFACFGSVSELLSDLETHTEEELLNLVKKRYNGLLKLRKRLGDKSIGYHENAGYEVFYSNDASAEKCLNAIPHINQLLTPFFSSAVFNQETSRFGFQGFHKQVIKNNFEGQIDTGKMMMNLLQLAYKKGVMILNGIDVKKVEDYSSAVHVETLNFEFQPHKVFIATNAFAKQLINLPVTSVRNQVLVTEKIPKLNWNTCFHLEEGYYYFRAIDHRILIGGGRNFDPQTETTSSFGTTSTIENRLTELLHTNICPVNPPKIDYKWSGILGVGEKKSPVVQQLSENLFCGVRMGGMGVALGTSIGVELANLINQPPN